MKKFRGDFRTPNKLILVLTIVFGLATIAACGVLRTTPLQIPTHAQISWKYEIVSIRPANPNTDPDSGGTEEMPDGYKATHITLMALIRRAYGVELRNQISGGPGWLSADAYDIQAKMDASQADALKKLTPSERESARQQMLQALLADRLKLIVHREQKELPVYVLTIARNGPKLHNAKQSENPDEIHDSSLESGRGGGKIIAPSITTRELAGMLTLALGRPVLDKTGLKDGRFNLTLQWSADRAEVPTPKAPDSGQRGTESASAQDPSWPSIFAAIQEQLGLKLENGKGPVEIIMIDHVEKPSGN